MPSPASEVVDPTETILQQSSNSSKGIWKIQSHISSGQKAGLTGTDLRKPCRVVSTDWSWRSLLFHLEGQRDPQQTTQGENCKSPQSISETCVNFFSFNRLFSEPPQNKRCHQNFRLSFSPSILQQGKSVNNL